MELHKFDYLHEMEIMLADNISKELEASINQLGKASLLVSGGTSPKGLFQILSKKAIDWSKVTVGLVVERFVSNENEASNEKLVNENLLINLASKAKFLSMVHKIEDEKENLKLVNLAYSPFFKDLTVVVLGMGEDGHTASLFPNDENSENNKQAVYIPYLDRPYFYFSIDEWNNYYKTYALSGENQKLSSLYNRIKNFPFLISYFCTTTLQVTILLDIFVLPPDL